jgi:hypothetical protein
MERGNELAGRGWCILCLTPALNFGQFELQARNSLRDGQVASMADAAAIGVGRAIVVMDLLGDGGGGLKAGKAGQQQQYQGWSYEPPALTAAPHHDYKFRL